MKKIIVLMVMMAGLILQAGIVDALKVVESNNKPNAIGDNGDAKGILQIHIEVIKDVNRIYKTSYVHDDAFNAEKAEKICNLYLKFYGSRYQKKTGKVATDKILAKIWNGGPTGYKNKKTNEYWQKVSNVLSKSSQVVDNKGNKKGKI